MTSFLLMLLSSSAVFANNATAQPFPADSIKNKQIREITVYSNLSKTLALPMTVTEKAFLDASSYFTPADALRRETGIALSRDGIWATSVNVRGLSEQRLLFLVNGDRIQTATDVAASLSTINMNNLDRIEVIKGASSVLYGSSAMGGIVNMITSRPNYSPTYLPSGAIGTDFNTINSLWSNYIRMHFSSSKFYLGIDGSIRTASDTRTPDGKLNNSQFHDASWGLTAGVLYSPNQELQVNYQHVGAWDVGLPGGSVFPDNAQVRYKNVKRNQLSAEYIISNKLTSLKEVRIKAFSQSFERSVENILPTSKALPSSNNQTWGGKITGDWRFYDKFSLLLGVEGWERKAETSRLKVLQGPKDSLAVLGEQPTPNARMYDGGVFAHMSWKIVPRKFVINSGLRIDYIRQTNDTAYNPLFKYTVKNDETQWAQKFNYKNIKRKELFAPSVHNDLSYAVHFDFVYNLCSQQQLALSVSNSYRIASIEERFKYIDQGANSLHVGNPNLKPEKGYFANLSYTLSYNTFSVKAEIFANYLRDLIAEQQGQFKDVTGTITKAYVNTNIGKAILMGAELETKWFISRKFQFYGNASYVRGRDEEKDTPLPQIAPLHGFTALTYQISKGLETSVSALWAAKQSDAALNETATDGYIVYSADVQIPSFRLSKFSYLHLSAGVDNILDKAYRNHLSTTRGIVKLEPGRNIYIKLKWGW